MFAQESITSVSVTRTINLQIQKRGSNRKQPEPVQAKEATNLFAGPKPSILLQTAQAEIFDIDNKEHKIVVRVVFDSGSQRSYVTKRVKDYLNLPVAAREQIYLKTFGQNKGKLETMDVTQFIIQDDWRPEEEKVARL